MLDSRDLQKREKQRLKELKGKGEYENSNGIDDVTRKSLYLALSGIVVIIIFATIVTALINNDRNEESNECERLGGEYVLVDEHPGYRGTVKEYGCINVDK